MLIAANWKMNLNKNEIKLFSKFLKKNNFSNHVKTCIFPQSIYIDLLAKLLNNTPVYVGGQIVIMISVVHLLEKSLLFL
jgi:triosephosphate isomerase